METGMKRITVSMTQPEMELLSKIAQYEGRLSLTATVRHILAEAGRERNLEMVITTGKPKKDNSSIGSAV